MFLFAVGFELLFQQGKVGDPLFRIPQVLPGACGSLWAGIHRQDNETPALNALKALRSAPSIMGRGEIPVELLAGSHPCYCLFY